MRSNTDVDVIGRGLFKEHLFGAVTYNDFKHNTAGQTGDDLISLPANPGGILITDNRFK